MSSSVFKQILPTRTLPRLAGAMAMATMLGACATPPYGASDPAVAMPGPQGAVGTPQGCEADRMADDALIGKKEAEVLALLQGCAWRLGERDGQQFPGTMDYNPARRTLGIAGGIVVWVRRG